MEWSDFPYSPLDEDLYGLLSNPSHQWNSEENKLFENALAEMDPSSPSFFDHVAAKIPWKTVEEIKLHYEALVNDVDMIESGNFPVPDYSPLDLDEADDEDEDEDESEDESEPEPEPEPEDIKGKGKAKGSTKKTKSGKQRRRGVPWTHEEHQLFLMGLNKYGKGDWRSISRYYVINKTTTQVASHAQKYFRRRTSSTPAERRRPSIHDIQTINPPATRPIPPFSSITPLHHSFSVGAAPILQQNPTFLPPPMNSGFPPAAAHPMFNQIAPAAYASTSSSCFLNTPNWG